MPNYTDIRSFFSSQQYDSGIPVRCRREERQWLTLVDLQLVEQALLTDESVLLHNVLSSAEFAYFQRFKYIKRKKEWLGGRIAAKAAFFASTQAQAAIHDPRSISILPNKYGRPVAEGAPTFSGKNLLLSLSHSDNFAVALVRSGAACGVDLQEISTKLAGLTGHFATDAELQRLAEQVDYDEDTRLTMLWTVKEALKKALLHDQSVIFSETELQEAARLNDSSWCFLCTVQGQLQAVLVYLLPPYILSITEDR